MSLSDEPEEILDLVDEHDRPIGTITRERVAERMMNLNGFVRSSSVFIINDRGEVWVPRRGAHKKIAPNGLDYSAGEHVKSGETYMQAAVRGLDEEVNIHTTQEELEFTGIVNNSIVGLPYMNGVFIYRSNDVPDYNKDDFVSYEWLSPKTFIERLQAGELGKSDLVPALELLTSIMNKR